MTVSCISHLGLRGKCIYTRVTSPYRGLSRTKSMTFSDVTCSQIPGSHFFRKKWRLRHVAQGAQIQDRLFSGKKGACGMLHRAQKSRIASFPEKKAPAACCRGRKNIGSPFSGKKSRLRHVAQGAKIQDRPFSGEKDACGMQHSTQKCRNHEVCAAHVVHVGWP